MVWGRGPRSGGGGVFAYQCEAEGGDLDGEEDEEGLVEARGEDAVECKELARAVEEAKRSLRPRRHPWRHGPASDGVLIGTRLVATGGFVGCEVREENDERAQGSERVAGSEEEHNDARAKRENDAVELELAPYHRLEGRAAHRGGEDKRR